MTDNVSLLPVWKKGMTAEEFFNDMALFARKHPEMFGRIAIVYDELRRDEVGELNRTITRYASHNANTTELIGMLEIGKVRVIDFTKGA